jgi:hypothetical protein
VDYHGKAEVEALPLRNDHKNDVRVKKANAGSLRYHSDFGRRKAAKLPQALPQA